MRDDSQMGRLKRIWFGSTCIHMHYVKKAVVLTTGKGDRGCYTSLSTATLSQDRYLVLAKSQTPGQESSWEKDKMDL